jgi:endonuclease YncB( thermonuclease family)
VRNSFAALSVVLTLSGAHAWAACPAAGSRAVVLKSVADGDTFFTASGEEVDLDGVLAQGSGGEKISASQARDAQSGLSNLLKQGAISLAFAGQEKDRYGRLKAQVFAGTEWVQGALTRAGLMRAAAGENCAKELAAAEAEARTAHRGHWGDGNFAVLTLDELLGKTGTFQIVEAPVQSVATKRSRAYLNFGDDWKTDFTVTVSPDDMKRFRAAHVNLRKLKGHRVRVRGWLQSYYGPEMEIAWPSAIEDLEPKKAKEKKPRKKKQPGSKASGPLHSRN